MVVKIIVQPETVAQDIWIRAIRAVPKTVADDGGSGEAEAKSWSRKVFRFDESHLAWKSN